MPPAAPAGSPEVWLAHVAMTPDPAYEERSVVLAVRNASVMSTSGTPNLDLVRSWRP